MGGRELRQDGFQGGLWWGWFWIGVLWTPELVGQSSSCAVSSGARALPSLPASLAGPVSRILTEHWLSVPGTENAFVNQKTREDAFFSLSQPGEGERVRQEAPRSDVTSGRRPHTSHLSDSPSQALPKKYISDDAWSIAIPVCYSRKT